MSEARRGVAAIVDFGMGNLFSVRQACELVGLQAWIAASAEEVAAAEAVILPGVGAFGDAMATLQREGLADALREAAGAGKPFMGICLGMQLLMREGFEFGRHRGLGILEGDVVRFEECREGAWRLKVPQIGWNQIAPPAGLGWEASCLEGVAPGSFVYFVHSFYVRPRDPSVVLATARYGTIEFCAALRHGNIFACQFHPERSGPAGLAIYRSFAALVQRASLEVQRA